MIEYQGKELIIMATSLCNANCSHCYISYKGFRNPKELLFLVQKLKEKYIINLNGAEVLTNFEYLKSYKEISQNYILSNGKIFLSNDNVFEQLKINNINSVSLSYHFGMQDDLSSIKESDLKLIICRLKDNNINYRLLTTITSLNYKMIPDMCKYAVELGAKGIKFTNFISQGKAKDLDEKLILSQKQINEFFRMLSNERKKYEKNELLIERCGTFGNNMILKDHFNCNCITDSVVLTPDNNIYPCVFLAQAGNEIGIYDGNKILINSELLNDHKSCIAKDTCNFKPKRLVKEIFK